MTGKGTGDGRADKLVQIVRGESVARTQRHDIGGSDHVALGERARRAEAAPARDAIGLLHGETGLAAVAGLVAQAQVVSQSIATGSGPMAVAINETTNRAYVIGRGDSSVTVIDGKTRSAVSSWSL